jgi:hypothetical protein
MHDGKIKELKGISFKCQYIIKCQRKMYSHSQMKAQGLPQEARDSGPF